LGREPTRAGRALRSERSNCGSSSRRRRPRVERRRGGAAPRGRRGRWNSPLELAARLGPPLQQWSSAARQSSPDWCAADSEVPACGGRGTRRRSWSLSLSLSLSGSGSEETSVPASSCRCKFGSFCCFFLAFSGGVFFFRFASCAARCGHERGVSKARQAQPPRWRPQRTCGLRLSFSGLFLPTLLLNPNQAKKNLERSGAIFFTFQLHFAV